MKRILFFIMAVFALASCGKDEIDRDFDLAPVQFQFVVSNDAGESLIV